MSPCFVRLICTKRMVGGLHELGGYDACVMTHLDQRPSEPLEPGHASIPINAFGAAAKRASSVSRRKPGSKTAAVPFTDAAARRSAARRRRSPNLPVVRTRRLSTTSDQLTRTMRSAGRTSYEAEEAGNCDTSPQFRQPSTGSAMTSLSRPRCRSNDTILIEMTAV